MDTYSSVEDLVIKTRKPYTITKQRERWTEGEHNRFLEALKLYGRAWQRIEEHIGTKTAVQIRSHAQKFFSKLEKEAVISGVPIGQALDIDIPPPRPKRRPTNPYPRKTSTGAPTSQKPNEDEKQKNAKDGQDDSFSEGFTLLQEVHHSSVSSSSKSSKPTPAPVRNSSMLKEFIPSIKGSITQNEANESYVTSEHKGNQKSEKADAKLTIQGTFTSKGSKSENSNVPLNTLVPGEKTDDLTCAMPMDERQAPQNYPRHVPVHVIDRSQGTCPQTPASGMSFQDSIFHPMEEVHGHPNLFTNPAASATSQHQTNIPRSSAHQSLPAFPPSFTSTFHNENDYQSFRISSTFSRLIASALYQNPAAHATASFAATFWPHANVENCADSPAGIQGSFLRKTGATPSMAAIAAATVAAATAWWAAHGLLPIFDPLHPAYTCTPSFTLAVPSIDDQAQATKTDGEEYALQNHPLQQLEQDYSEIGQVQHSSSKSPTLLSSDTEGRGGAKLNTGSKAAEHEKAATELNDSNKAEGIKLVDRSSCGSNTTSSSEVETDALGKHEKGRFETHEKGKEEPEEPDANHLAAGSSNRRGRSASCNMSDSWKSVSEWGRLAFQALFSREVLPQSFLPANDVKNKVHQKDIIQQDKQIADEKDGNESLLDLNSETCGSCSSHQGGNNNGEDRLLTIGLAHGKLKAQRTVFKPYKRCSVEANENKLINGSSQGEEKGPKRIRLEEDART